jgi:hypothetical protein
MSRQYTFGQRSGSVPAAETRGVFPRPFPPVAAPPPPRRLRLFPLAPAPLLEPPPEAAAAPGLSSSSSSPSSSSESISSVLAAFDDVPRPAPAAGADPSWAIKKSTWTLQHRQQARPSQWNNADDPYGSEYGKLTARCPAAFMNISKYTEAHYTEAHYTEAHYNEAHLLSLSRPDMTSLMALGSTPVC